MDSTGKMNYGDLAPLKFPKIHPEEAAREYLRSKTIHSLVKKYPEWDVARGEPGGDLMYRKRELYDSEQQLKNKKKWAIRKRAEVNGLWKDLEDKENTLKSNFCKFNNFVKENQEKRERSERKLIEVTSLFEKRSADIDELTVKYDYMYKVKSDMEKNIKSHKLYEKFLEKVRKLCPTFRTNDLVLDRYEALVEARNVLSDRQEEDLSTLEDQKGDMMQLTEEKTLEIMGLNNVLGDLQARYEIAKTKALHWERMVSRVNKTLCKKLEDMQNVRQACWTQYLAMCNRKEIEPTVPEYNIEKQLLFIRSTLGELKRIMRIALRRNVKFESLTSKSK